MCIRLSSHPFVGSHDDDHPDGNDDVQRVVLERPGDVRWWWRRAHVGAFRLGTRRIPERSPGRAQTEWATAQRVALADSRPVAGGKEWGR